MKKMKTLLPLLLLLSIGLCADVDIFCSLVSLNSITSWCTCENACNSNSGCGVKCDSSDRITSLSATNKNLKTLPDNIGSLTSLTYL